MSTERDVTPIVRSWLQTGPTALPDRVLDDVLGRLPATPQRRPPWPMLWRTLASTPMRIAAAVAVGIFAVIGLNLLPLWGGVVGTPDPSPSTMASPAPSPGASPRTSLSLEPPTDVDAYVTLAYEGLVDLPPLSITVVETEGTKARYMYDGAALVHHDHFGNANDSEPSEFRIFSRDTMAERSTLDGQTIWLQYAGQGHPLRELAFGVGLQSWCERSWEYLGLEYLIDRPTHHVACGGSEMWLDVETRLPLRSIRVQGGSLPTVRFDTTELQVGPQPADLFVPPTDLRLVTAAEFECASDPGCQSPRPEPTAQPVITPAPASVALAVPSDLDVFVAEVLATHAAPPGVMVVMGEGEGRSWHLADGSGRFRQDYGAEPSATKVADMLVTDGHSYESHEQDDGSILWADLGPPASDGLPDLGISQRCRAGWEHRGFDLVLDRPAHHLVCGYDEYWVDSEWLLVTRHQRNPDPLGYDADVEQVAALRPGAPPAELFQLPADADVRDEACFRRGRPACEPRPSGSDATEATGSGPALTWTKVDHEAVAHVAWVGDRFVVVATDGSGVSTSTDGVTWESLDAADPDAGYGDVLTGSGTIATWEDGMIGWDTAIVRSLVPPGAPATKSDFQGPIGAVGIGPAGIVARVHSGIDFDAFVTTFLGPDWVGQIKEFDFTDGVLHIATDDGRAEDIVMADHDLGPGDVADRGYGWYSQDGADWKVIAGFPSNVTDIVGVSDGFIARGESMLHSPDGMTWNEIGPVAEGSIMAWQDGAMVIDPSEGARLWTNDGPRPLSLPSLGPGTAAGALGLVAVGSSDVLFTPNGTEWSFRAMPEAMYASGGDQHPPQIAVGDDAILVLMWSGGESPVPTLWRGTISS